MNKQFFSIIAIGLMLVSTILTMIPANSYGQMLFPVQMQLPNTAIQNQQQNPYLPPVGSPQSGMTTQDYMYLMQLMQQYMQLYGPNNWQDRYWQNDQVIKIIDKDDDDDDDDGNDHKHKDHKKSWWWKDGHKNGGKWNDKDKDWKDKKDWWDKEKAAREDHRCDDGDAPGCGIGSRDDDDDKDRDEKNKEEGGVDWEYDDEDSRSNNNNDDSEDSKDQEESNESEEESSNDDSEDSDSDDDGGDSDDGGGSDDGGDSGEES
jgi:hypothetical protein